MIELNEPHRVLFTSHQIAEKVAEMGREIARDYEGQALHVVGVLRGALPFLADLVRALELPAVTFDFVSVRRKPNREPELIFDLDSSVAGKNVLLVEDLVGEGRTLNYLLDVFRLKRPASLKVCSLLERRGAVKEAQLDYSGWEVEGDFLVGYGLDREERLRELPFIAVLTGHKETEEHS